MTNGTAFDIDVEAGASVPTRGGDKEGLRERVQTLSNSAEKLGNLAPIEVTSA